VRLLRYVVECTVTDSSFNTQANCSKCPPSAWIHFLTCVARELVTLRSTAAILTLFAALRIRWSSSSLVFTLCALPAWGSVASFQSGLHKFPNRWIGRGGTQNWPPRPPDKNSLDYHVWGDMKPMAYAHMVNTREELFQRILSAAKSINIAAVLRKVTSPLVTHFRKCIQANGGHFEQFVWMLNGESVTVHLTTYLNKCTMVLLFSDLFAAL